MPADNFAPSWSVFATSLPRPVSLLRCSRCTDQSPPCQRGVPRLAEAGGFRRQSLRNFLPIPSSLFTKKPSPFHMGSYFGKVPPVESLSQKSKIFASSLSQGSLRAVPADNFAPSWSVFATSLPRPISLPGKTGNENIRTMHALTASARRTFGMRCKKGACCKILTLQQAPFYTGNKNEAVYYRAEAESFLSRPLWVITTWRMVPSTSSTPSSPRATYRALSQKASPM